MSYLLYIIILIILLTAWWNGLVIHWKNTNQGSKTWHAVGAIIRALLCLIVFLDYGFWIAFITAIICWIPYNIIINLTIGQPWFYIGKTSTIDKLIRKILRLKD